MAGLLLHGAAVRADSFDEALLQASADKEKAREKLAEVRALIAREKTAQLSSLSQLHASVRELRQQKEALSIDYEQSQRVVRDRETKLQSHRQELAFATNRLLQMRTHFEETMHPAERGLYAEVLLAAEKRAEAGGGTLRQIEPVRSYFDFAETALRRLREQIGGRVYGGSVLVEGVMTKGRLFEAGPTVFFRSENRARNGIIRSDQGLRPVLHALPIAENLGKLAAGRPAMLPIDPSLGRASLAEEMEDTPWRHIVKGGVWMIPILFFGVTSLVLAGLKHLQLRKVRLPDEETVDGWVAHAGRTTSEDDFGRVLVLLHPKLRAMFAAAFRFRSASPEAKEVALQQAYHDFKHTVEGRLSWIALTATVSPLFGLLGTVTGMIKTFQAISLRGSGDAKVLSSGISEALITTEYGLIVAIPALIAHALLARRARRTIQRAAVLVDRFAQADEPVVGKH